MFECGGVGGSTGKKQELETSHSKTQLVHRSTKHQALKQLPSERVGADLSAFYQCDMLAYQGTLYVHSNRQFYINCLVAGTIDFTFGNAATVLQDP
ncbi:hypothetical protein EZV62_003094 [Acer yangbiense]|uniref:Pectinesterase catalytic domain-containing protein n=1 Tax=Acer yangbiense TaxID=1000413 RepID=A0A5C7IGM2_9ROSI|nr:hypothetical protein EZV62_003094 [Acer yangbiense]